MDDLVNKRLNINQKGVVLLEDDEEISLEQYAGFGFAMIGDSQEYGHFTFASDATVTLLTDISANTVNTDTDAKFCIYQDTDTVKIKNRLGSTLPLLYDIKYVRT